jgi:competence protein ComEA
MNKSLWWVAAFIIVGVLLGAGIIYLVTRPPKGEPIVLLPAPTQSPITVYVSGAIETPGLFTLPAGSRVNDVIQAAGGTTENADIDALNLAKIVEDGEQIIVPEDVTPESEENGTVPVNPSDIMVNINTATLEQLDTLPGIGPKTAQNIIDYRTANGPFTNIEEIQDVPNIGQVTFDKIKALITTGMSP